MNPFKSYKRNIKRKVARSTGIPTTKAGRKRKGNSILGKLGLIFIVLMFVGWFFQTLFSA